MTDSKSVEECSEQGSWWGSWISSAKSKSAEVYSMVKKDLDEIGNAVKSEASQVYSATSSAIEKTLKLDEPESTANVMKKSLSSFLDQVSTVLNPQPDDDDTEVILCTGDTTLLTTYKRELEALQRLDATFLVPAISAEFEAWKATLEGSELNVSRAVIDKRLANEPILREQYEKLVPGAVDSSEFWDRYLFRVALLQDRLAAVVRHGNSGLPETSDPVLSHLPLQIDTEDLEDKSPEKTPISQKSSPHKSVSIKSASKSTSLGVEASLSEEIETVAWEEDFSTDVELTEEQQTLLLQEYEKEIATKKQHKTPPKEPKTEQQSSKQNATSMKNEPIKNATSKNAPNKQQAKQKTQPKASKVESTDKLPTKEGKNKKSDACVSNLIEDHFKEDAKSKDDSSSTSDASWEKEFEIDDA